MASEVLGCRLSAHVMAALRERARSERRPVATLAAMLIEAGLVTVPEGPTMPTLNTPQREPTPVVTDAPQDAPPPPVAPVPAPSLDAGAVADGHVPLDELEVRAATRKADPADARPAASPISLEELKARAAERKAAAARKRKRVASAPSVADAKDADPTDRRRSPARANQA